ncbi:MAG: DUF116 domain-containing protein [Candidatus Krumholzibacteria bacterium]|nr:DUF116 domain-containing protein [Candidatus Krumholzibacteria bacterium]
MDFEPKKKVHPDNRDRVLGDEWLDWNDDSVEKEVKEGKSTFLFLSIIILISFILLVFVFWYLVLPRFELYGRNWTIFLTGAIIAVVTSLLIWYIFLLIAVLSRKNYLNVCLQKGTNLFIILYPFAIMLAKSLGISQDRLGHSFIRVSNSLARSGTGMGQVLVLLPRCLKKDLKIKAREICKSFPNVILHTAPGGNVARRIIRETNPKAIVAAACERDLVSGIQDIAPKIPVIGIPNTRPLGPCKDTSIDLEEFQSALEFFCKEK